MDENGLNEAESLVWRAYPVGERVELEGAEVRGEVLAALLLGAVPPRPGFAHGIWLSGARVTGRLRLKGTTVDAGLHCADCAFEEKVEFVDSTLRTLRIERCRMPELDCSRLSVDGFVGLDGSEIGELRLEGARVGGPLSMSRARTGWVRAQNLQVGGRLSAQRVTIDGEFMLHNAQVGSSLHLSGATLRNPGGTALGGGGLTVGGGCWLWHGFTAEGGVRLVGARLDANLTMDGARLDDPGGAALDLSRAEVGAFGAPDLDVRAGLVVMRGTTVRGDIDLVRASLPDGLEIDNTSVNAVHLGQVRSGGEIMLRGCQVQNRIFLLGAEIRNPDAIAVRLSRTVVGADVYAAELIAEGELKLARARVGGTLSLPDIRLKRPGGFAIDGHGLQAGQLNLSPAEPIEGVVRLSHAQIGVLRDRPETWPRELVLSGLRYEALEPRLPAKERLPWVTRGPDGYESQPYEQLATYYAATGQNADARCVLHAKEKHRQATEPRVLRVWSRVQDVTTGYGYRPWRALLWLAVLLTIGGLVYGLAPPEPLKRDEAPHFNPVMYTLDLLIPIVDLGQERAFNPAGAYQWLSYVLVAAGWVLATTVAAGAARVVSRR